MSKASMPIIGGLYDLIKTQITASGQKPAFNATTFQSAVYHCSGTFAGGNVTFEGSTDSTDGVNGNWFQLQGLRTNANTLEVTTGVLGAMPNYAWTLDLNGINWIRLNCTALTSGSWEWFIAPSPFTVETSPYIPSIGLSASANLVGDVGQEYRANATGAASNAPVMSPATPAATVCKAAAGRLLGVMLQNSAAAIRSVKFWNTAQGSVTLGTTAALFEIDIPAGGAAFMAFEGGIGFATAITYAITGAKGLTDNTGSLGANDVSGVLIYA